MFFSNFAGENFIYILVAGIFLDLLIGDPNFIPHPVVLFGKIINFLENKLLNLFKNRRNLNEKVNRLLKILSGGILVIIVVFIAFSSVFLILKFSYKLNYYFGLILNIYLFSTTIAINGLVRAGNEIYSALKIDDIELARSKTDMIVGRDTEKMSKSDIIRASIETIAENTSDGIMAPLFFFFIGGVPLAMAYKAINTLDSMLGHKNEKYLYFGKIAARLDDLANYIPARLCGYIFSFIALLANYNGKKAFKIMKRDAKKHPSPNAGFPEAAAAGALNIRLGGINYYQGKKEFRSYLGDDSSPDNIEGIKRMIFLLYYSTALLFLIMFFLYKVV